MVAFTEFFTKLSSQHEAEIGYLPHTSQQTTLPAGHLHRSSTLTACVWTALSALLWNHVPCTPDWGLIGANGDAPSFGDCFPVCEHVSVLSCRVSPSPLQATLSESFCSYGGAGHSRHRQMRVCSASDLPGRWALVPFSTGSDFVTVFSFLCPMCIRFCISFNKSLLWF